MVAITAQLVLDRNNYSDSDVSLTNLEYMIDDIIRTINLETGSSISAMTGVAKSKTVTVTDAQSVAIHTGIVLMIKAYTDRGPNANVATLGVSTMLQDPQYAFFSRRFERAIQRLRGRSIERV